MFETGQIIAKRYELQRLLGKGAMGSVFLAKDQRLAKDVAIKFINAEVLDDTAKKRFVEEGKSLARLNHDNIVRVYATGREGDSPFIVTEFIDGHSLREEIDKGGSLAWKDVFSFSEQLFRALAAGHKASIVHRDVKPENIMVTASGKLILTDFGIARRDDRTRDLTGQGIIIGTPAYIAPEIWHGERACPSSDIYSAALVVYEMTAGRYPLKAKNLTDYADFHLKKRKPRVKVTRNDCPTWFDDLLAACLVCDKSKRSGDAFEIAQAIAKKSALVLVPETAQNSVEPRKSLKYLAVIALLIAAVALFFIPRKSAEPLKDIKLRPKVGEVVLSFKSDSAATGKIAVFHQGKQIKLLPLSTSVGDNELIVRGLKGASDYEMFIKLPAVEERLPFTTKEVKLNSVRAFRLRKRVSLEVDATPREDMSILLSFSTNAEQRFPLPKEEGRFVVELDEAIIKKDLPLSWQVFWKDKLIGSGSVANVEQAFHGPPNPRLPNQGVSNMREPSGRPIWTKNGFIGWFRDGTLRSFSFAKTEVGLKQDWLYEHPGQGSRMRYHRGVAAVWQGDGVVAAFGRPSQSMAICFLKPEERKRDWQQAKRNVGGRDYWRPGRFRVREPEWVIKWNGVKGFKPRTNGVLLDDVIVFHGTTDNRAVAWIALDKEKRSIRWSSHCPQKSINDAPAFVGRWQSKKGAQSGWWVPYPPVLAKDYVFSMLAIGAPRIIHSFPFALTVLPLNSSGPTKPRVLCRFFANTNRCQVALDGQGYAYWTSANGLMRWKIGDWRKLELFDVKDKEGASLNLTGPLLCHKGAIYCFAAPLGVGVVNLRQTFHLVKIVNGKAFLLSPPLFKTHDDRGVIDVAYVGNSIFVASGRYVASVAEVQPGRFEKRLWNPGMYTGSSFPWLVTLSVNDRGFLNLGQFDGSVRLLPTDILPRVGGTHGFDLQLAGKWKSLAIPK